MDLDAKATILFTILGIIIGYASFLINSPPVNFVIAVVVFAVIAAIVKNVLKIKEAKGWWTNKIAVFFFVWLIVWTVLFNMYIVFPAK